MIEAKLREALDEIEIEIQHMELLDHAHSTEYRRLCAARRGIKKALRSLSYSGV